jgi:antitoxin component YwqK of YwqJK toxin-antitoxin module
MIKKYFQISLFFIFSTLWLQAVSIEKEKIYYPSGSVKIAYSNYLKDGKRVLHGKYEEFYTHRVLKLKKVYTDGFLNGESVHYYPNKKKKSQGSYSKGVRIGKWIFWSDLGVKRLEGTFDSMGNIQSMLRYNNRGEKQSQEIFEKGKLVKTIPFDTKGEPYQESLDEKTDGGP